jgi:hypothetical protein
MISKAARESGRTLGEELVWRAQKSLEWEKAFGDARAVLADAYRAASENLQARLQEELRRQGYRQVRGMNGSAWFEPGVNAVHWIFDTSNKDVLEEMLERAATRALEKAGRES